MSLQGLDMKSKHGQWILPSCWHTPLPKINRESEWILILSDEFSWCVEWRSYLEIRLRGKLLIWYQYYAAVGHGEFESVRLISKWSVLHLHRKDSKENDIQTTCSINLLPVVQEASPWYSFASFFPFAFSSSPHFLSPKRAPNLNCITPLRLLPSKG